MSSLDRILGSSGQLPEKDSQPSYDISIEVFNILNNLTYHRPIIEKIANLLGSYGFLPVESFEQKDYLTHKGINTFVFWHPNGGEMSVSVALKEDFGESFRTDMTPSIPVKSELFGFPLDCNVVIKIDYMELNPKDIDIELHKTLTKSITQAVFG